MGKGRSGPGYTYSEGRWIEGNPKLLGPQDHGVWLSSVVFDGARAFDGLAPDLDRHCQRATQSARLMGLEPKISGPEIEQLARDGIGKFPAGSELYICPMFYAEGGFITPDPDTTRFILTLNVSPLPPGDGFSALRSSFRRPAPDQAPTEAKASCLYPNVGRCVAEARQKGFDTAVVLDPDGHVAEFAYTNLFLAKDGVVHTPAVNGTFLNGITRQRVIQLLRDTGTEVIERAIPFADVRDADELFATGNYAKVHPCTRIEDRELQPGPLGIKARDLYFEFAKEAGV